MKRGLDPTRPLPSDLRRQMAAGFADKLIAEMKQRHAGAVRLRRS